MKTAIREGNLKLENAQASNEDGDVLPLGLNEDGESSIRPPKRNRKIEF